MNFIISTFGDNDIALIQWAFERKMQDVVVIYPETGFGTDEWEERVVRCMAWCESLGFRAIRTFDKSPDGPSIDHFVKSHGSWPEPFNSDPRKMFCRAIKSRPVIRLIEDMDPHQEGSMLFSARRDDEGGHRALWPEYSETANGREVWYPMVRVTDTERAELIERAGMTVLNTRNRACSPCIFSTAKELAELDEDRIDHVESIENNLSSNGPVPMFDPQFVAGAVGIRQVVMMAKAGETFVERRCPCDGGWCGA
jgi:hypothetical protein